MKIRFLAAGAIAATAALALAGCAGGSSEPTSTDPNRPFAGTTITYWASQQSGSLDEDERILSASMDRFQEETGIEVELEVIPWTDLTNNTLAAAVSGQGPDVVNLGNTNAATFQATGAFVPFVGEDLEAIGGSERFVEAAWATTGAADQDPTSVPLYSQVYGLYYNLQLFDDAGLEPPTTWEELVDAAETLTDPDAGTWGIVAPAGTVNASMHIQYIFANQDGGTPFLDDGTPDFETDENAAAVRRFVDLMESGVMNPSAAQYTEGSEATAAFAAGNVGMIMSQTNAIAALGANGMTPDQFGVVPVPAPEGGEQVGSFIAGSNVAIFQSTEHRGAALELVRFLTSPEESETLNGEYGSLPPIQDVPATAFVDQPELQAVWTEILADHSIPMAQVPSVQAYQANMGGGIVELFATAATGGTVSDDDIDAMLTRAQQGMATG